MALTLAASIDAVTRYFEVAGTVDLDPGQYFRLDDEMLQIQGYVLDFATSVVHPERWYVRRGLEGSTAASHAEGAAIVAVSDTYGAGGPFAGGGGGGASDLETVLATGNATGEHTIVMPFGSIDGTSDTGDLLISGGDTAENWHGLIELDRGGPGMNGGDVQVTSGVGGTGGFRGGDIHIQTAEGNVPGRKGLVFLHLPTTDPLVAGALWANLGIVTVSAG